MTAKPTLTATQRELRTLTNTCKSAADRAELAANASANHLKQIHTLHDYAIHTADAAREHATQAGMHASHASVHLLRCKETLAEAQAHARTARRCMLAALIIFAGTIAAILTLCPH